MNQDANERLSSDRLVKKHSVDGFHQQEVMGIKQAHSLAHFYPPKKRFQTSCTQPTHANKNVNVLYRHQFQVSYTWAPFRTQVLIVAPAHGLNRAVGTVCRATT